MGDRLERMKGFFGVGAPEAAVEDSYLNDEAAEPELRRAPASSASRPSYGGMYSAPARPKTVQVSIDSYREAAEVGGAFRAGDIVVFDLHEASHADAKSVVDFAAGLCYALRGKMKRLEAGRFVLFPEGVSMSVSDLRRQLEAA